MDWRPGLISSVLSSAHNDWPHYGLSFSVCVLTCLAGYIILLSHQLKSVKSKHRSKIVQAWCGHLWYGDKSHPTNTTLSLQNASVSSWIHYSYNPWQTGVLYLSIKQKHRTQLEIHLVADTRFLTIFSLRYPFTWLETPQCVNQYIEVGVI